MGIVIQRTVFITLDDAKKVHEMMIDGWSFNYSASVVFDSGSDYILDELRKFDFIKEAIKEKKLAYRRKFL